VAGTEKLTARPENVWLTLLRIPKTSPPIPEPVCEFHSRANTARSSRTCHEEIYLIIRETLWPTHFGMQSRPD